MDIRQIQDLIKKYNAGLCTAEEKSLLEQWYLSFEWEATTIPFSEHELHELKNKAWQAFSNAKQSQDLPLGEPANVIPIYRKKRQYWWYVAAACLAFVFFATWKWWPTGGGKEREIVYQQQLVTQKGSRSQVLLPDGSKVWLNAGSKLDYPKEFNSKTRNVQLQGEAYFEVMKDNEKPFFVHTNSFDIKVLGTGFNVRAYLDEDSAVTSLVHGSVEVIVGKKEKRTILLRPNEKITLPMNAGINETTKAMNNTPGVADVTVVKEKMAIVEDTVQSETAWINNKLAFKKMSLENVALLLEKWFDADIRFKNEEKKVLHFTGVYTTETLDEILYTLEATGTFHYKKDSNGVIWIE